MALINHLFATQTPPVAEKPERSLWDEHLPAILLACGTLAGACFGAILTDHYLTHRHLAAKDVLAHVKQHVNAQEHEIEGSWIEVEPVTVVRFNQEQTVYYGGFAYREDKQMKQFEFYVNPKDGQIIDIFPANAKNEL
ncbi:MAG: hypothetical protein Q4A67_06455 [Aerococcus sp.]|nr:hypothetical protein [Aerococcus sp.]